MKRNVAPVHKDKGEKRKSVKKKIVETAADSTPEHQYFLVRGDALPDIFHKVLRVKGGLDRAEFQSVNQACRDCQLSRSAYYKYRDMVHAYSDRPNASLLHIFICMEHEGQSLSRLTSALAEREVSIVHISQSFPSGGFCYYSLGVVCKNISGNERQETENLASAIRCVHGVRDLLIFPSPSERAIRS